MRSIRRVRLLLAVTVAAGSALAIAACGSGSGSTAAPPQSAATTTSTTAPVSTTTTTTTVTASSSPVSSSATTTSGARARAARVTPGCRSGEIAVSVAAAVAGLGHVGEPLVFENVGRAACFLTGYPGVALAAGGGHQVQVRRTPNGYLGGLSPTATSNPVVRLRPGDKASALLEGEDGTGSGGACPSYVALLVTPPNQTVTSRVARPTSICDSQIHPVVPGTAGTQR
jgi:hypothetical protein